jgi:hypothetical protein
LTDEQIVAIHPEADRTSVAEVAKKNKVSEQTLKRPRPVRASAGPNILERINR